MNQFLPLLKSKELEKQFRQEEHKQNRTYFYILCLVEVINFSYGFAQIIQEGIINSKLISSYVTMLISYIVILLFNYRGYFVAPYLVPLVLIFHPVARWINGVKSLSFNTSSDYLQGIVNGLSLIFHMQSPSYFFKLFCLMCYASIETALNINQDNDKAAYGVIAISFTFLMIKQYIDDKRLRQNFLQNQRLFMWSQLIDQQIKMNFFVAKPKKNEQSMHAIYSNKLSLHFINKYARSKYLFNTTEKFNSFLERIEIQEDEEDNLEEGIRSRFISDRISSNRLLSTSRGKYPKKTLLSVCQELVKANQHDTYAKTLSNIQACSEFTGFLQPEKTNQMNSKKVENSPTSIQGQRNNEETVDKSQKAQAVQIKLFYYNLTEDYLIIQIEEEDYKLKAKKQREEQRRALAFRDNLIYRMKSHIESVLKNIKLNFEIFKQLPNYKSIMFEMYLLKQYQQNIILTFTDFNIQMPFEISNIHLKKLIISLMNLFSDDSNSNKESYPEEILSVDLQDDIIQTSPNQLNYVIYNLMLNCKQHGLKNSQIQVKVYQDLMDQNIINIDIVNEISQRNEQSQLVYIDEIKKVQSKEELFNFYYEKQKQIDHIVALKQIKNNIKNESCDTPDNKSKCIIQETLKYALGIYVSRQSLKKIGPSGSITYTITKSQEQHFLIASFQIYKDLGEPYRKEKEEFLEFFGKNMTFPNMGQSNNGFVLKRHITEFMQQSFINNHCLLNDRNTVQKDKDGNILSNKQIDKINSQSEKNSNNQQDIKDFIYSKAIEMLKNPESEQNQLNNSPKLEKGALQNYKNSVINNHLIHQSSDQGGSSSKLFQSVDKQFFISNSSQSIKNSVHEKNTPPQKSLFYRDISNEDQKNEENNNIINVKQYEQPTSAKKLIYQNSDTSDIEEVCIDSEQNNSNNQQTQKMNKYKQSFKKNPGQNGSMQEEYLEQVIESVKQAPSFLTSQKQESLIKSSGKQKTKSTIDDQKIEQSQSEEQITSSTPGIGYQKPLIIKQNQPIFKKKMLDE